MRLRPQCSQCDQPADVDKGKGVYLCAKCEMANIYDSMSARDEAYLKSELYRASLAAHRQRRRSEP